MTDADVDVAQTWTVTVAAADDPPEPHTEAMWADHPTFSAVFDSVQDDYVELTVSRSNDHPRAPAFGEYIATTTDAMLSKPEWSLDD